MCVCVCVCERVCVSACAERRGGEGSRGGGRNVGGAKFRITSAGGVGTTL